MLRLDDLGFYQFERLVQVLLKSLFSISAESWGGRGDHGIDALCTCDVNQEDSVLQQPIIVQVKFVENANAAGAKPWKPLRDAIVKELRQIEDRDDALWTQAKSYLLVTNAMLSPENRETATELIRKVLPSCAVKVWHGKDIEDFLLNRPKLRQAFPQLLGIADIDSLLTSIVSNDILQRSNASLALARDELRVFVATKAYYEAISKLHSHKLVVITGPPEMGKTIIARNIGIVQLAAEWLVYDCRHAEDFWKVFQESEKQLFIADDAFGSIEFDPSLTKSWVKDFGSIVTKLDDMHWLVWTTRKFQLEQALNEMKKDPTNSNFPDANLVIVDAAQLETDEKIFILYRHSKAALTEKKHKQFIRTNSEQIVENDSFTPLRIKYLVSELSKMEDVPSDASAFIERCMTSYNDNIIASIGRLDDAHKAYLLACLGSTKKALPDEVAADRVADYLGSPPTISIDAIYEDLKGYFVK